MAVLYRERHIRYALFVLIGLWYILHSRLTVHVFGGITGDLAGFYISLAELLALVCAAFGGMVL